MEKTIDEMMEAARQRTKDAFVRGIGPTIKCKLSESSCHHRDDKFKYGCNKEDEECAKRNSK